MQTIKPGETLSLTGKSGEKVDFRATSGALLGPPWQATENGYIIQGKDFPSFYYEPHCMFDAAELSKFKVDCVITPIVPQRLPGYTLVDGGKKAIELCRLLNAKAIIPMANGELDASGILSKLLITPGERGVEDFENMLRDSSIKTKLMKAPAGDSIKIQI